jgi:hypothetical protein
MKRLAFILAALILAGCGTATTPDPIIKTEFQDRPVAVKCVPDPPVVAPDFADSDANLRAAKVKGPFDVAQARVIGRLQHFAYEGELVAALNGCTG